MKSLVLGVVGLVLIGTAAQAESHRIRSYVKKDGTYVAPSRATNPNRTRNDNWSTKPNVNPYTGKAGTRSPDYGYKPYKAPKTRY